MFARKEVKKMQSIYRTITADKLTESLIGAHVTMCGWVENIRDHGGVSFIDLRDFYGVVQVVMREKSLLDGIGREDCISVSGPIEARDEETYNPKIPTGTIELGCKSVRILGKVKRPLPFEVLTSKETREDIRLKYRFLDMRNRKVKENIVFRAKVISFLRSQMEQMGFLEVQTPILCASSPEGARDYIVPSRRYKGKFYALPQAPQQYKQLLMVGGIDRYFQIAPCFRDEDARADRSPGEFYQLDFEMAFATQEDVFSVGEKVLYETFKKICAAGENYFFALPRYTVCAGYARIRHRQARFKEPPAHNRPHRILFALHLQAVHRLNRARNKGSRRNEQGLPRKTSGIRPVDRYGRARLPRSGGRPLVQRADR